MTLLGLYRESVFSPGKVRDDAAILDATLQALSGYGYRYRTIHAERLDETPPIDSSCIITMAQSLRVLGILEKQHDRGMRIINSVASVRNCYRKTLFHLLLGAGLPLPQSEIIPTEDVETRISFGPRTSYWLKRGDVHAMEAHDVVKVASREELETALRHFRDRGITDTLVQEHIEGEVVKFYGAGVSAHFSAFLASSGKDISSQVAPLQEIAREGARVTGLDIYGGDAIITSEQKFVLIDLNDWPSFSRCREAAAGQIACHIANILQGDPNGPSRTCSINQ
jgi:glutathione synthase/RimK-type ligase-like ATP-grasp enzyme